MQVDCSVWKAYLYFRTMGLRHLPVVDKWNCVVGIITRKDFLSLNTKNDTDASYATACEDQGC
jgi:CBS-domain-containing membrane protein